MLALSTGTLEFTLHFTRRVASCEWFLHATAYAVQLVLMAFFLILKPDRLWSC